MFSALLFTVELFYYCVTIFSFHLLLNPHLSKYHNIIILQYNNMWELQSNTTQTTNIE